MNRNSCEPVVRNNCNVVTKLPTECVKRVNLTSNRQTNVAFLQYVICQPEYKVEPVQVIDLKLNVDPLVEGAVQPGRKERDKLEFG